MQEIERRIAREAKAMTRQEIMKKALARQSHGARLPICSAFVSDTCGDCD